MRKEEPRSVRHRFFFPLVYMVSCHSIEIRLAATTALHNSVDFFKGNFEKQEERDYIMTVICETTQALDNRVTILKKQIVLDDSRRLLTLFSILAEDCGPAMCRKNHAVLLRVHAKLHAESTVSCECLNFLPR